MADENGGGRKRGGRKRDSSEFSLIQTAINSELSRYFRPELSRYFRPVPLFPPPRVGLRKSDDRYEWVTRNDAARNQSAIPKSSQPED
jgi:hypothetical protein